MLSVLARSRKLFGVCYFIIRDWRLIHAAVDPMRAGHDLSRCYNLGVTSSRFSGGKIDVKYRALANAAVHCNDAVMRSHDILYDG